MSCEELVLSAACLSVIRRAAISEGNDRKGLGIPNKQTPYLLRKALLAGDKCDRRMCIEKRCVTLLREKIKDTIILMDRAAVGFN